MSRYYSRHRLRKRWFQESWAEVKVHLVVSLVVSVMLFVADPRTTLIVGGMLCQFFPEA